MPTHALTLPAPSDQCSSSERCTGTSVLWIWFDNRTVAVDIPLESDLLGSRAPELPGLSAEVIKFLREEVGTRLGRDW